MNKNIPTQNEISPTGLLDEKQAAQHFLGKNLQEAQELFHENAFLYGMDLMWMGFVAFSFYYQAFSGYLRSSNPAKNIDVLNQLLDTINFRLRGDKFSEVLREMVLSDLDFCSVHYDEFQIDQKIDGDILGKLKSLQARLKNS